MKKRCWYLIRHGQTDYNAQGCFYGSHDPSINALGQQQARDLADVMAKEKIEQVYTSQLRRSQETARLIFPTHRLRSLVEFNEKDFGLWEGLTANQIQASFPREWQEWLAAPLTVTPPEAESFANFQIRVWQATADLLATEQSSLVLVLHLGVLRLIYQYLIDWQADFWEIDIPQGQVMVLEENEQAWQLSCWLGRKENGSN